MLLNALKNNYTIYFPYNFFYSEIRNKWTPIIKRLKLPYEQVEDFINSNIQSISFPGVNIPTVEQGQSQFKISYTGGKEMEPLLNKELAIVFKLSEGFITYWILFHQCELFLKYGERNPFWPPMYISFLDHHGFQMVEFEFEQIIPLSLSQLDVNYSTVSNEFSTFTFNIKYNRFNTKYSVK